MYKYFKRERCEFWLLTINNSKAYTGCSYGISDAIMLSLQSPHRCVFVLLMCHHVSALTTDAGPSVGWAGAWIRRDEVRNPPSRGSSDEHAITHRTRVFEGPADINAGGH